MHMAGTALVDIPRACVSRSEASGTRAREPTPLEGPISKFCSLKALAVILEGPFFHVIPMPVPAKHTQAHTHTCTHTHAHTCVHTHVHTCSDPRRPLLSCYPRACSSKTHAGAHMEVHTQHTYAHTHMHTRAHSQAKSLCCRFPLPPSSVSFTTGPRPGHHSSAREFSHHTLPFSTMSHTTSR